MKCPGCGADMNPLSLEGRLGTSVDIDMCAACQAFWFDQYESLHLTPAATLKLFTRISENHAAAAPPTGRPADCPRCHAQLLLTHDLQQSTPFQYWRCPSGHGRFIGYLEFLKEKEFIRPVTPAQLAQLRESVKTINCANCGAAIDLLKESACPHCGSPLTMIDVQQMHDMVSTLKEEAERPKEVDPALPLLLAQERAAVERRLTSAGRAPSVSLVDAGLSLIAALLKSRS